MNMSSKILATALMAAAAPWLVAPAAAVPISSSLGLQNAVAPQVETVAGRGGSRGFGGGRGYRGGGYGGAGVGLGIAGAIIGGAIIGATQPYGYYDYGYGPGYGYAPGYDQGYVGVPPYAEGGEVAYCQQRFRSYDPASGTYLGVDGLRHPCP
ncbi:MAG: BA14K family protein [Xanthobacteraceae bacterium]